MKKPWIVFAIRPPRENYRVFKHFCGEFETKKKALAKATEFVASDNPNAEINLAETGMFDITLANVLKLEPSSSETIGQGRLSVAIVDSDI